MILKGGHNREWWGLWQARELERTAVTPPQWIVAIWE